MRNLVLQVLVPEQHFWSAMKVYYDHPNSINKQVLFSQHIYTGKVVGAFTQIHSKIFFDKLCDYLEKNHNNNDICNFKQLDNLQETQNPDINDIFINSEGIYLLLRKLIAKKINKDNNYYEFLLLDKENSKVFSCTKCIKNVHCTSTIDPLIILKYNYLEIEYDKESIKILHENDLGERAINWLKAVFLFKLKNIIFNIGENYKNSNRANKLLFTSKIDIVNYYRLYERMKLKYAKYFIENWMENTDPKKFVFEDIGIATYLMLLWNGNNKSDEKVNKQKFIDLGCGNGLLVHILNSEGHSGIGLDLRKRKIWETYHSSTVLKEQTIIPATVVYPDADWLIGNHSDELTAWIPILARRSNNHCQYFVLPCCPYQLNGQKFQRKNSSLSSYHDFINHVREISELCHFETFVDRLRIPSTKRICLIGCRDPCGKEENDFVNKKVVNFVNNYHCRPPHESSKNSEEHELSNCPVVEIKIRDSTEKVRNCTKLDRDLVDEILKSITETLTEEKCKVRVVKNGLETTWNRGRKLPINKLAEAIDRKHLSELKKQCKGLQTMLKNHHYIFDVSRGCVQFRSPDGLLEISNRLKESGDLIKWKKRSCWFYTNHPDKCPLPDELCSYSHEK